MYNIFPQSCVIDAAGIVAQHFHVVPPGPPSANLPLIGIQILVAVWVFVLGACFGSFLNVVIYRLPAGMSLGKPKSRCPRCETPLAAKDNIPILGWLLLKGKCRYCSLPIAPRYPTIEATCGLIFLTLMLCELVTGGGNLPLARPEHLFRFNHGFWLMWFTRWDILALFVYHCALLVMLLAIAMIGFDGHRPVRKLVSFAMLSGLLGGTFWYQLRPVHIHPNTEYLITKIQTLFGGNRAATVAELTIGLADGLCGVAAGALSGYLLGWQLSPTIRQSVADTDPGIITLTLSALLMTIGAFLGWQAAGMMLVFAVPMFGLISLIATGSGNCQMIRLTPPIVFLLTWLFLLTWKIQHKSPWMFSAWGWQFGSLNWWSDWILTFAGLYLFAAATRFATGRSLSSHGAKKQ